MLMMKQNSITNSFDFSQDFWLLFQIKVMNFEG